MFLNVLLLNYSIVKSLAINSLILRYLIRKSSAPELK